MSCRSIRLALGFIAGLALVACLAGCDQATWSDAVASAIGQPKGSLAKHRFFVDSGLGGPSGKDPDGLYLPSPKPRVDAQLD